MDTITRCGRNDINEPRIQPVDAGDAREIKRQKRNARRRENARAMREAMESCGLKRVRGALGGIYWE